MPLVSLRPSWLHIFLSFIFGNLTQHFLQKGCESALRVCSELHKVGVADMHALQVEGVNGHGKASSTRGSFDSAGKDIGYLEGGTNWWFNTNNDAAFAIFDLDQLYPDFYHKDHVPPAGQVMYVSAALAYCSALLGGAPCSSVAEFGTASCFFTAEFLRRGVDVAGLDGARSALANCLKRGIPTDVIRRHDLRFPVALGRRFSMALCTEVAEHIEPPFSSQLISNLVHHSDIVWFSFEGTGLVNPNHIHHNNEQPEVFWINLFAFYGYSYVRVPRAVVSQAFERAGLVFFNTKTIALPLGVEQHSVLDVAITTLVRPSSLNISLRPKILPTPPPPLPHANAHPYLHT